MIKFKTKYVNQLMFKGKKNKSELIFFNNCKKIQKSYNKNSTDILKISTINSSPFFNNLLLKAAREIS